MVKFFFNFTAKTILLLFLHCNILLLFSYNFIILKTIENIKLFNSKITLN